MLVKESLIWTQRWVHSPGCALGWGPAKACSGSWYPGHWLAHTYTIRSMKLSFSEYPQSISSVTTLGPCLRCLPQKNTAAVFRVNGDSQVTMMTSWGWSLLSLASHSTRPRSRLSLLLPKSTQIHQSGWLPETVRWWEIIHLCYLNFSNFFFF